MTRIAELNRLKQGINRLRSKGGADADSLYDLENGYIAADGSAVSRPGLPLDATLPAGTKGLMTYGSGFLVFSNAIKTGLPAGYACEVLVHPTDAAATIAQIHFAKPFLGAPYVSAEFSNTDVFHYWLQPGDTWAANTAHREGDVVVPTVANGLAYRAKRLNPASPAWAPGIQRTVGDVVEPTTPNGFKYTVIEIVGAAAASGDTEPAWVAEDGAAVAENVDVTPTTGGSTGGGTDGTSGGTSGTPDRYCVAATMSMGAATAGDVLAGDLHPCHKPGEGFTDTACAVAGEPVLQPCVRLVTRYGAALVCSRTTPFTFPGANEDLADGQWAYAPEMRGRHVYVRRNGVDVVEDVAFVFDAGELPVVPLDFGGRSFAAGEAANVLIYSHNMAKSGAGEALP